VSALDDVLPAGRYVPCADPGAAVRRWDTPRRNQGQAVTRSYGGPGWPASEWGYGDPYKRVSDAGEGAGPDRFYRWVPAAGGAL